MLQIVAGLEELQFQFVSQVGPDLGTAAGTLAAVTGSGSGGVAFSGTAALTLQAITGSVAGTVDISVRRRRNQRRRSDGVR